MAEQGTLRYSITDHGVGLPKGVLSVSVSYYGTSNGRKATRIKGLANPDCRFWDKKTRRFKGDNATARLNNPVLDELCVFCDRLLAAPEIRTTSDFIDALRSGKAPRVTTLGMFIEELINDMRTGKNNKRPSRNYQIYRNLLHKLQREKEIIDVPISEIDNSHFIRFGQFLLTLKDSEGRSNYTNLMKTFKQVHTRAYERSLNDNTLRYPYAKYAPLKEDTEKMPSMSLEQYHRFCDMDLSAIPQSGPKPDFYKTLYHDFCIFLYEIKSRPADVLRAKESNIVNVRGVDYLRYIPEKKKNFVNSKNRIVYAPLTDTAKNIIDKYKGESSKGYVFPFSMNNFNWDANDAESWNRWNTRKQRALQMINQWLKRVREVLGIDIPVTLYTFRHSALTHACMAEGANWGKIALESGTSINMLEKNYVLNV